MIIGIPREIKREEKRVGMTPEGVSALVLHGHRVLVEQGAGLGSGMQDVDYRRAGAEILPSAERVWSDADMVLKVKEPVENEHAYLREGQIVFTYLHLAANRTLTETLLAKNVTGIAYETIQLADGSLPLLAPMSEVAGRLSLQVGAWCLESKNGGSGILLSGVSGVPPAKVVIVGAGIVGINACHIAVGIGANVVVMDINPARLRYIQDIYHGLVTTVMSNRANIDEQVASADLLITSVLIPGARAPQLIPESLIRRMKKGSAIVDVAIDQGGCLETSRPTTHDDPVYIHGGVVHYCVSNMPGAVPRTSTYALTNSTLQYVLELADHGFRDAVGRSPALKKGVNVFGGKITHEGVAGAFHTACEPLVF
ncbi:MAG: alanine dehydrogenase [bacterium]